MIEAYISKSVKALPFRWKEAEENLLRTNTTADFYVEWKQIFKEHFDLLAWERWWWMSSLEKKTLKILLRVDEWMKTECCSQHFYWRKSFEKYLEAKIWTFRTETGEEEIRQIFSQYGTIKRFKFFEKDRKMALIEMDTIEQAITALIVSVQSNDDERKKKHWNVSFRTLTIID